LLFKDGGFRWNRLENLLRNARDNSEYDLDQVLDQTLEFIFSERGEFLRDRIVSQLIEAADQLGQSSLRSATTWIQQRLGLVPEGPSLEPEVNPGSDLQQLLRILTILQETQGFDPIKVASRLPPLLFKPETQAMGQAVFFGLAQRLLVRQLRRLLIVPEGVGGAPQLPPAAGV
jgi:hypothetical protein